MSLCPDPGNLCRDVAFKVVSTIPIADQNSAPGGGVKGRREYIHEGSTAAIPAADACQSSQRPPPQHLSKLFHARS